MKQPALFAGLHPTIRQVKDARPLSTREVAQAEEVYTRSFASRCPHDPACGQRTTCIRVIAREMREKGYL